MTCIFALHWLVRGLALAVLGAAAGLGHAPMNVPLVTVLAFAAMLALHRVTPDFRTALWHGWAFGLGYFGYTLRWIVSPFLVYPERDGWMAPFGLVFMAAGAAIFWMIASGAAHRLRPGNAPMFAVLLVAVEALRSLILTGFPWGLIGHTLISTPYAQLSAFTGPHGLSALVCLAAWAVSALWTADRIKAGVVLAAIAALWPVFTLPPAPEDAADAPIVRLVQPNAPQDEKWDIVKSEMFFDRMLGFTSAGEVPDLIVWPETAIADLLNYAEAALEEASDAARGAPIILGANRRQDNRYYNSFVLLGRGGLIGRIYDKQHLVPFGEYVPGGELLGMAGIPGFASSTGGGFSSGTTQRLIDVPGIGNIRPLICYEGIFAEEVGTQERPRALILITNDAWFGKDAGPFQHLAQARLRAIEQGLPMVRAANTGVSTMIDGHGRVRGQIALNTAGFLDVALPPVLPPTFYVRWGDWPFLILLGLIAAGLVLSRPQRNTLTR